MTFANDILGAWVHAHEEGDDDMVFRPAGTPLPPSRGRAVFEFRPDGTFVEGMPGATDASERASGHWSLHDDTLTLSYSGQRPAQTFRLTTSKRTLILPKQRA